MRPRIFLYSEPCDKAKKILQSVAELTTDTSEQTDIIWTGLKPVDSDVVVACPCTGVDHITAPHIIYLDDEWKHTEGHKITSTAEHTWSLILQLAKLKRMQLIGKKIGIIGLGRIGTSVAKFAWANNMSIVANDTNKTGLLLLYPGYGLQVKMECLECMLKESDIITLHVPLNDTTRGMIGKEQFAMMKPGALLINTSRHQIVDEPALVEAIKNNSIGGYADDFYRSHSSSLAEALIDSKVDYIGTDHVGGNCTEAREATDIFIANKVVEYIKENL